MPGKVTLAPVKNPDAGFEKRYQSVSLKSDQLRKLIDFMHMPEALQKLSEQDKQLEKAIKMIKETRHQRIWEEFLQPNKLSTKAQKTRN